MLGADTSDKNQMNRERQNYMSVKKWDVGTWQFVKYLKV